MGQMPLEITIGSNRALARLDRDMAPATCDAIAGLLPFKGTAHVAKLAGDEIMVHLPLILDMERRSAVADLSPGAVAFWPERQVFCVYFGAIQDEDAEVTLLGHVDEGLAQLVSAGETLHSAGGGLRPMAGLSSPEPSGAGARHAEASRDANDPMHAYGEIATEEPAEIRTLLGKTGVMRPVGALVYAEAETRKLHELLWLLRGALLTDGQLPSVTPAIIRHFVRRLAGWYGLHDAGRVVSSTLQRLEDGPGTDSLPILDGLILYVGRLNFWLDARIPWDEFNEVLHGMNADARSETSTP